MARFLLITVHQSISDSAVLAPVLYLALSAHK
jgi:hypothetical protein